MYQNFINGERERDEFDVPYSGGGHDHFELMTMSWWNEERGGQKRSGW